MSSFKSYWSSIKYHAVTRPSIHHAGKLVAKIGQKVLKKGQQVKYKGIAALGIRGRGSKPGIRQSVLAKTRGVGASTSKTLFSRRTAAGQARRNAAASRIKSQRAARYGGTAAAATPAARLTTPARRTATKPPTRTTPTPSPQKKAPRIAPKASPAIKLTKTPITRSKPHSSVQEAIAGSKTHGQLRRKVTGLAVRTGVSARFDQSKSRSDTAAQIRAIRKHVPGTTRNMVRDHKKELMRKAAEQLAKRK